MFQYTYIEELFDHMENLSGELVANLEGSVYTKQETSITLELKKAQRMRKNGNYTMEFQYRYRCFFSIRNDY